MNDEEIMKRFNETFSEENTTPQQEKQETVTPYRATANQSASPTNMTVPTSNNNNEIPPLETNQVETPKDNPVENKPDMMKVDNNNTNNTSNNTNKNNPKTPKETSEEKPSNVNYNYVPTQESAKKKTISIKISPEFKPIIVIVIILFIAIMIIPSIYNFITRV